MSKDNFNDELFQIINGQFYSLKYCKILSKIILREQDES